MAENDLKNYEKRIPHSIDAERAVIGCLIQNNELVDEAYAIVSPEMFYDPINRALFKSIGELKSQGVGIDKITLFDKTSSKASGETIYEKINNIRTKVASEGFDASRLDDDFFIKLIDSAPTTSQIADHCNVVKDKYLKRKGIETSNEIIKDCIEDRLSSKEIFNNAQGAFFDYSKEGSDKAYSKVHDGMNALLKKIQLAAKTPDGVVGLRTGYKSMDLRTAGFQPSTMIVLAARPGCGKTAFSLNLAYNMCSRYNYNVLFYSLEMNKEELLSRIVSLESGIDGSKLRHGNLNSDEWGLMVEATKKIKDANIYVDDNPYLTIAEFRNKSLKLDSDLKMQNKKLDAIFIDYLQLMHAGNNYKNSSNKGFSNRQEEVAEISRSIKGLAKEMEIPIIALSQLSRSAEQNKRPQLSDLRESGAIEQDADIVMLIHSDRGDADSENKDITEIIFAKHRSGETGIQKFHFNNKTTEFAELDNRF